MDLEAYEKLCAVAPAAAQAAAAPAASFAPAPVAPAPAPAAFQIPTPAPVAQSVPVEPRMVGGQAPSEPVPAAAPVAAPKASELTPRMPVIEVQKMTQFSEIPPRKKPVKVTPETMGVTHVMADLTQEELIDKINRDIGAWKTAQDRRRTDELKSAAKSAPQFETASALEEEERFYLEPIE